MYRELEKHFLIRKIFNIRRELKAIKKQTAKFKVNNENENSNSTYLGLNNNKKPVFIQDNAKHVFLCGTTGSGKTIALSNFIKHGIDKDYPMLIVDGKGDIGENSILDIVHKLGTNRKIYTININSPLESDKYNPFQNTSPTIIKDMLINMTNWTEEHYKLNTERFLQRLIDMLSKTKLKMSFANIIKYISTEQFTKISGELVKRNVITKEEHLKNMEIAKASGKIAEDACARFSTIIESELGSIFDETGIDIITALKQKAIIVFILNPLLYPEISPLLGRLILIDSKKAVSSLFNLSSQTNRVFFIFDEINVYVSPVLLDLVNKSRSANVTCILATQSLSDLDYVAGEYFKEQVIENCNNYLVLRQNSAVNAENWGKILGTRQSVNVTYQLGHNKNNMQEDTGYGSARRVREFLYHPDDIKSFRTGQGVYMSKDNNTHCKINIHKPF